MSSPANIEYYAVLEIPEDCDLAAIKTAYRKLVLLHHPDKNPTDREASEKKIREINYAYEILSNKTKRQRYDKQDLARRRPKTHEKPPPPPPSTPPPAKSPKSLIPKEILMQPMGSSDAFVRHVNTQLFCHARNNTRTSDFFGFAQSAKFFLYWLNDLPNLCRIHASSFGEYVVTHCISPELRDSKAPAEAELVLQNHPLVERTSFLCTPSPDQSDCYRFECFHARGFYLAYSLPYHLKLISQPGKDDVIDFCLLDHNTMSKFINFEEVFIPVVTALANDVNTTVKVNAMKGPLFFASLAAVKSHQVVMDYFQNVREEAVWDDQEFEEYFHAHFDTFEFRKNKNLVGRVEGLVRVRTFCEHLEYSLDKAQKYEEVVDLLALEGTEVEEALPDISADAFLFALRMLCNDSYEEDLKSIVNRMTAQKRMLMGIPKFLRRKCTDPRKFSNFMEVLHFFHDYRWESLEDIDELRAALKPELEEILRSSLTADSLDGLSLLNVHLLQTCFPRVCEPFVDDLLPHILNRYRGMWESEPTRQLAKMVLALFTHNFAMKKTDTLVVEALNVRNVLIEGGSLGFRDFVHFHSSFAKLYESFSPELQEKLHPIFYSPIFQLLSQTHQVSFEDIKEIAVSCNTSPLQVEALAVLLENPCHLRLLQQASPGDLAIFLYTIQGIDSLNIKKIGTTVLSEFVLPSVTELSPENLVLLILAGGTADQVMTVWKTLRQSGELKVHICMLLLRVLMSGSLLLDLPIYTEIYRFHLGELSGIAENLKAADGVTFYNFVLFSRDLQYFWQNEDLTNLADLKQILEGYYKKSGDFFAQHIPLLRDYEDMSEAMTVLEFEVFLSGSLASSFYNLTKDILRWKFSTHKKENQAINDSSSDED